MTTDALADPDGDGSFPHLPRNSDGSLDVARVPVGTRLQRGVDGVLRRIDVEPTLPDGRRPSDVAPLPPPPPVA